jgi:DNA-directed RNA polymerase specialized sigma24 family protein
MPDRDLDQELDAIARGDADAFARWLSGAEHELRRSLRPVAAWVDAEAVMQEALLRIWQVAPRFVRDGQPNGLLRLAVTVCRNCATSEMRRLRPEISTGALEELGAAIELGVEPATPDPLLRRLIEKCREKLPGKPAQALMARLNSAGADTDETLAERLGMRLNTFLQNFTRARKLLAECLGKQGVEL